MIQKKIRIYNQILQKLKASKYICLISHTNPDIDTIGSSLGFYQILKDNFSNKKIDLVCVDDIPNKYKFLDNTSLFKNDFNPYDYDLIIFLDSSSPSQTGFAEKYPKLFDKKTFNTLCIDHHVTNTIFARQNIVNANFASTTMIIFEIFSLLKFKISSLSSTYLLAGIYTDTGGLKHSNTSNITLLFASKLIYYKADLQLIVNKVFKTNKLSTLKLWGKIISDSFIKENILYSFVNQTDLDSFNTNYEDISGIIDYLNMVENVRYTTLFTQKGEYIKASLRTLRDDIDLSQIAKKYSGGGHKKASGFSIEGKLEINPGVKIVDN